MHNRDERSCIAFKQFHVTLYVPLTNGDGSATVDAIHSTVPTVLLHSSTVLVRSTDKVSPALHQLGDVFQRQTEGFRQPDWSGLYIPLILAVIVDFATFDFKPNPTSAGSSTSWASEPWRLTVSCAKFEHWSVVTFRFYFPLRLVWHSVLKIKY